MHVSSRVHLQIRQPWLVTRYKLVFLCVKASEMVNVRELAERKETMEPTRLFLKQLDEVIPSFLRLDRLTWRAESQATLSAGLNRAETDTPRRCNSFVSSQIFGLDCDFHAALTRTGSHIYKRSSETWAEHADSAALLLVTRMLGRPSLFAQLFLPFVTFFLFSFCRCS